MDTPITAQPKFTGPRPPTPPSFSKPSLSAKPEDKKTSIPVTQAPVAAPTPVVADKKSEDVVIRTMKDDLANIRQPVKGGKENITTAASPSQPIPAAPLAIPLPNQVPKNGKSVFIPTTQRKDKRSLRLAVSILMGLIIISGGGVGIWYVWQNQSFISQPDEKKDITEIIPKNAVSVVEYTLGGESRSRINDLWAQQSVKQPTFDTLLSGDPRLLLSSQDVDAVYYIQLAEETRPFLVVPITESTQALFENSPQTQYETSFGWFIAHPLNPAIYKSALEQGSMKDAQLMYEFANTSALRIYLSEQAVAALRPALTNSSLQDELLQSITIRTDAESAVSGVLSFDGIAQKPTHVPSIVKTDTNLLKLIPAGTTFAYAGHDIANAIAKNINKKDVLSADTLNQAAVQQLMQSFRGEPFVAYRRTQEGTSSSAFDVGVIIKVPLALNDSLKIGDPTLEAGIFALVPGITGNQGPVPSLAFADGVYNEIPLRYVNIAPGQALDYAIVDSHLLIASSKEGMFLLLDAIKQQIAGTLLAQPSLQLIQDVITTSATSQTVAIARVDDTILKRIIPAFSTQSFGYMATLFSPINDTTQAISGLLVLPEKQ